MRVEANISKTAYYYGYRPHILSLHTFIILSRSLMYQPPPYHPPGMPMNHQGAFSPMALPPNTVLVPAEDPSNPGNTLFRLVTIDPNNPHPHAVQPGMQPQQNMGYEQEVWLPFSYNHASKSAIDPRTHSKNSFLTGANGEFGSQIV